MEESKRSPPLVLTPKICEVYHSCLLPDFHYLWISHHLAFSSRSMPLRHQGTFLKAPSPQYHSLVQRQIKPIRAHTLALLLILGEKHSIFHHEYDISYSFLGGFFCFLFLRCHLLGAPGWLSRWSLPQLRS